MVQVRMKTAPNRELKISPGPNPQISISDWRAAMQSTESWLPVLGYEGVYEVSSEGRVRRALEGKSRGARPGVILKVWQLRARYLHIHLHMPGSRKAFKVHRLVAFAFHGDPKPGEVVRHLNGDFMDNRAVNLVWGTMTENMADRRAHGTNRNRNTGATHCKRGHAFDEVNTYVRPNGTRVCRECGLMRRAVEWGS